MEICAYRSGSVVGWGRTPRHDTACTGQGGAGAASGPVGNAGVSTRGQIATGNGPAPVSARGGIRNTNAPASSGAQGGAAPTLANTGSAASIAAGAGVIALAGGVTLVIARKRH